MIATLEVSFTNGTEFCRTSYQSRLIAYSQRGPPRRLLAGQPRGVYWRAQHGIHYKTVCLVHWSTAQIVHNSPGVSSAEPSKQHIIKCQMQTGGRHFNENGQGGTNQSIGA